MNVYQSIPRRDCRVLLNVGQNPYHIAGGIVELMVSVKTVLLFIANLAIVL